MTSLVCQQGYSLKGRHVRSIRDLTPDEIMRILHTSRDLKQRLLTGERPNILEGRTLGMIFQKPSLRTMVSFQVAMNQLGGHAIYLGPDQIKLGERESVEDVANVLSGYVDGIMARVFGHNLIEELAKYSRVPVINGLSDYEHPSQILGDVLTIIERKERIAGIKLAFIGDGNNVANSLAFAAGRLGFHMTIASPSGYELPPQVLQTANEDAKVFCTGGKVEQLRAPQDAAKDADVLYTDVWTSMGQEAEKKARQEAFKNYIIDEALLNVAKPDAVVLHCLPAHYGEEIAAGMQRNPHSLIFPQAENRMHAEKGLLALVIR